MAVKFNSNLYVRPVDIFSNLWHWKYIYVSTGSGNGFAPNKRQNMAWTNDDAVYQYIDVYEEPGTNKLRVLRSYN